MHSKHREDTYEQHGHFLLQTAFPEDYRKCENWFRKTAIQGSSSMINIEVFNGPPV